MEGIKDIIVIKQLPVIEEKLKNIGAEAVKKINIAMSMPCTSESKQAVKGIRASLNADFKTLEEMRKDVENKIDEHLRPFRDTYRQYITNVYKDADATLKARIAEVEDAEKQEKENNLREYFEEAAEASDCTILEFERVIPKVDLSKSVAFYKKQIDAKLEQTKKDLAVIDNHEYSAELMVEYIKTFDLAEALVTVTDRHIQMADFTHQTEDRTANAEAEQEAIDKVDEALSAPEIVEDGEEDIIQLNFACIGRHSKVKEFKNEIMAIANQKGIKLR